MKIYSGRCVGGPWNGQNFAHHKSYFILTTADFEVAPCNLTPGALNFGPVTKTITYYWTDGEWRVTE